jgi:hypothetical protein
MRICRDPGAGRILPMTQREAWKEDRRSAVAAKSHHQMFPNCVRHRTRVSDQRFMIIYSDPDREVWTG